eukprot:9989324-Alexandrium_andersonii.AAC.1
MYVPVARPAADIEVALAPREAVVVLCVEAREACRKACLFRDLPGDHCDQGRQELLVPLDLLG